MSARSRVDASRAATPRLADWQSHLLAAADSAAGDDAAGCGTGAADDGVVGTQPLAEHVPKWLCFILLAYRY